MVDVVSSPCEGRLASTALQLHPHALRLLRTRLSSLNERALEDDEEGQAVRIRGSGQREAIACAAALAIAFALPADEANAFSEPIGTKMSLIKWSGTAGRARYKFVSKPVVTSQPSWSFPLPTDDLTLGANGSVTVTANDCRFTCILYAWPYDGYWGWRGLGSPVGSNGWVYRDRGRGSTCKFVLIKENVIRVLTTQTELPVRRWGLNSDVAMELRAGTDSYCALATAPHLKEVAGLLLKMKDQPPPVDCPAEIQFNNNGDSTTTHN